MESKSDPGVYILAVEDDPMFAASLELTLQELGYQSFSIVDNATDALKIFKERSPDIVLLDIEINGPINGIEFAEIISAIRLTPIIYVTAFADTEMFQKAKLTRPSAYIIKPYHSTNLQAAIELAILNQDEKHKELDPKTNVAAIQSDALFVKYNNRLLKLRVADLLYIEVDEKYCYVHTQERRYAVNIRLKHLLNQLPANTFVQTHRSFAVKLEAIEEVNLEDNLLKIKGREIPVGKTFKEPFFSKLRMI